MAGTTSSKNGSGAQKVRVPQAKSGVTKPKAPDDSTILINFVLDKSGSMEGIRAATISGFNEFKNDQAREKGCALITLTLFDTRFETVAEATPIGDLRDLNLQTYAPGGCTALYDAIGHTMRITDEYVAKHSPDQVLFVVMTDGEENSSREFDQQRIFKLIEERQRDAGYEFIYLGANQDSFAAATAMGVRAGRSLDYAATAAGAKDVMYRASRNVAAHRHWGEKQSPEMFSPDFEKMADLEGEALEVQKLEYVRKAKKD